MRLAYLWKSGLGLALACCVGLGGGCSFIGADPPAPGDDTDGLDPDRPGGDATADGSLDESGDGSGGGTDDGSGGDTTESCEPVPETSCAQSGAPPLRALTDAEFIGLSSDAAISDLVVSETTVSRLAPREDVPGYGPLTWFFEPTINVGLSPATADTITSHLDAFEADAGPYAAVVDVTLRVGDQQVCFNSAHACDAFAPVHEALASLDAQLLAAWYAQDHGHVYPIESVVFEAWPLDDAWQDGEQVEVSQAQWESLESRWYVDDDRYAVVRRWCTGSDKTCTAWTIEATEIAVAPSPLSEDEHEQLLALGQWIWPWIGYPVQGEDFEAVRNAHAIVFDDPIEPGMTRFITTTAMPALYMEQTL